MREKDGQAPAEIELRQFEGIELRAVEDAGKRSLVGVVVPYNTRAKVPSWGGDFDEVIAPGAFATTLSKGTDVRALVEHIPAFILARTKAGTLRLTDDDKALRFELDLPDTQRARDAFEDVRVGNLSGMSFGFIPTKSKPEYDDVGRLRSVTHLTADLREITLTAQPVYTKTSVAVRSLFSRPVPPADVRSFRARIAQLLT